MANSGQGNDAANEMSQMRSMIGDLCESVKSLSRQQAAPGDQIKECLQLTNDMKYEQRCLKRAREGDGKKQGIVKQQNLLDELACQVKAATDAVAAAKVYVPKDPNANMTLPAEMKLVELSSTIQGKEIDAVLTSASKLLAARLLELCVVATASSVSVGWATVESLSGASYGDYCEDEKEKLRVKEALAEQEKRAVTVADRAQKEKDRSFAQANAGHKQRNKRGPPPVPQMYNMVDGVHVPPPPSVGAHSISSVMQPAAASAGLPASRGRGFYDHSANDLCYRCQKTGHRSFECPNPPAAGHH